MKTTAQMIPAPTAIQPGGYVRVAYPDKTVPLTTSVEVEADEGAGGFRISLSWPCETPQKATDDSDRFVDAAAVLAPRTADAPWITMGEPGKGVEGILWRADKERPGSFSAEGLGTVAHGAAPADWQVEAAWSGGAWRVTFTVPSWPVLGEQRNFAVAVWQGAASERAGLKSVSAGWIAWPA